MKLFGESWRVAKPRWWKISWITFLVFLPGVVSLIPYVGVAGGMITLFLSAGMYRLWKNFANTGELRLGDAYKIFRDKEFAVRLIPYLVYALALSGFFIAEIKYAQDNHVSSGIQLASVFLISFLSSYFTLFAVPLMALDGCRFIESVKLSMEAFRKNWRVLLAYTGVLLAAIAVPTCLILPLALLPAFPALQLVLTGLALLALLLDVLIFLALFPALSLMKYLLYQRLFHPDQRLPEISTPV
ncbi:MAG: hypothetical protein ACXWR1_03400 [Bdellovibrionota bacterium]